MFKVLAINHRANLSESGSDQTPPEFEPKSARLGGPTGRSLVGGAAEAADIQATSQCAVEFSPVHDV